MEAIELAVISAVAIFPTSSFQVENQNSTPPDAANKANAKYAFDIANVPYESSAAD